MMLGLPGAPPCELGQEADIWGELCRHKKSWSIGGGGRVDRQTDDR